MSKEKVAEEVLKRIKEGNISKDEIQSSFHDGYIRAKKEILGET